MPRTSDMNVKTVKNGLLLTDRDLNTYMNMGKFLTCVLLVLFALWETVKWLYTQQWNPPRHRTISPEYGTPAVTAFAATSGASTEDHRLVNGYKCLNLAVGNYYDLIGNSLADEPSYRVLQRLQGENLSNRAGSSRLERRLAEFVKMKEAIVYPYNYPYYKKVFHTFFDAKKDIIFCDEKISMYIINGIEEVNVQVIYFKHNNLSDLEKNIKECEKNPKVAFLRKNLIVEAIYSSVGDICPIDALVQLSPRYRLRIFLDESVSFGALGMFGHGAIEYFEIDPIKFFLITASLGNFILNPPAFSAGNVDTVMQLRYSSYKQPYFRNDEDSEKIINYLEDAPINIVRLRRNSELFQYSVTKIDCVVSPSHSLSPVKHISLRMNGMFANANELQQFLDLCLKDGVAFSMASHYDMQTNTLIPSVRICISADLLELDIALVIKIIQRNAKAVIESGNIRFPSPQSQILFTSDSTICAKESESLSNCTEEMQSEHDRGVCTTDFVNQTITDELKKYKNNYEYLIYTETENKIEPISNIRDNIKYAKNNKSDVNKAVFTKTTSADIREEKNVISKSINATDEEERISAVENVIRNIDFTELLDKNPLDLVKDSVMSAELIELPATQKPKQTILKKLTKSNITKKLRFNFKDNESNILTRKEQSECAAEQDSLTVFLNQPDEIIQDQCLVSSCSFTSNKEPPQANASSIDAEKLGWVKHVQMIWPKSNKKKLDNRKVNSLDTDPTSQEETTAK